eukprot:5052617-Pyramimonas_sp.AAC.1
MPPASPLPSGSVPRAASPQHACTAFRRKRNTQTQGILDSPGNIVEQKWEVGGKTEAKDI